MKSLDIEIAVARMFGTRQNIIVPNVSWGAGLHECDLLMIRKTRWAFEIEIKTSKQDLKKDLEKEHGHKSEVIKGLYYAFPEKLLEFAKEILPDEVGLIKVWKMGINQYIHAATAREPSKIEYARKMTVEEIANIGRLGCMRIWNLKEKLREQIHNKFK